METWDSRYAALKYSLDEPHQLLIDLVKKLEPGKALDVACGTGRHAVLLAENGWQVTAVDYSPVGVGIAHERASENGLIVDFRVADLEKGEFEIEAGCYDLICDFYYLQRDLFASMKSGVKPGGMIISTIHLFDQGAKESQFLLNEGELAGFFSDFQILHYHETAVFDQDGGHHHRRTAEIIAQKTDF